MNLGVGNVEVPFNIVFVILAAVLPIFCWIPWFTPGLKKRDK